MKQDLPQNLIRALLTVLLTTGALALLVDSGAAYALSASLDGDPAAVCADEWASAEDPQTPVVRKFEDPADAGYHDPRPLVSTLPVRAVPPRTHFARAPPRF